MYLEQGRPHLQQPLVKQCLQAEVGFAQAHTQSRGHLALVHLRVGLQQAQHFQGRVLVDGNIFGH